MLVLTVLTRWRQARPGARVARGAHQTPRRSEAAVGCLQLSELRDRTRDVLRDCTGVEADRLRIRIGCAADASDLWLMRCDIFQVVANQHLQTVAANRINDLLPAFDGWLPRSLLAPVADRGCVQDAPWD
ncbi:hypothetical protein [Ramlibacter albus]|uniref:Uncharacterized protein n=1 Tax=Ramlibacter albus TaxID=2079448 RepID=A0A923S4F2_9BURK|nr:hypothetical protein [Ramlibacter albus]MBC5767539.1 hypothetical protein [Ramlibacter albus]